MPRKGDKTGVYVECEYCGKLVYKTQTNYKKHKHHYCSNACQRAREATYKRVDRVCPICGKVFNTKRCVEQIYCSKECLNEHNRQMYKDNPRPSKKIKCNCDYCGKEIEVKPSHYTLYEHHFCDSQCSHKWFNTYYANSEEWKEKSRIRAVNVLNSNIPTTQTKPQIKINQILDDMNIAYRNEESFKYYSADNYLDDYNLVIEVMGDYWHGSPLKYDMNNVNKVQRKAIGRDKSKHTYILNYYQIPILYLWEHDINNNEELCRQLIAKFIQEPYSMKSYNSFNYHMQDSNLVMNDNIIISLAGIV